MTEPMRIYVEGAGNADLLKNSLEDYQIFLSDLLYGKTESADFLKTYRAGIEVCEVEIVDKHSFWWLREDVHLHRVKSTTKIGGEKE